MTKKNIAIGALSLAIMGTVVFASGVSAYRGDMGQTGPLYSSERHEQMEKAFASNDYNAWKSLMNGRGRVMDVINEGNFNRFAEAHKLAEEGKIAESVKIRQELGLGQGGRNGDGTGRGQRGQNNGGNFVDANGDGRCDRM